MEHEHATILSIPFGPSDVRTASLMAMITQRQNVDIGTVGSRTFRRRHIGEANLHGLTLIPLIQHRYYDL